MTIIPRIPPLVNVFCEKRTAPPPCGGGAEGLFPAPLIKGGVAGIEVFAVEVILGDAEGIEETVRVKYFDIYISNAESIKL